MKRSLLIALVSCLVSSASLAQNKVLEDKKAPTYNEIERGVFFGVNGGFEAFIVTPGSANRPFSPGQAVQVEFGYDIGERISPSLFLIATSNRASADYTGYSAKASGDFSSLTPGVGVKIRLVGFADEQEVQRSWFYVRAQAGFTIYQPSTLIDRPDLLISAGPGFEYFTRLRHFSIGVEATFNFMALTQSIGFSVLPSVRYAF
jgi:hypothetical protein